MTILTSAKTIYNDNIADFFKYQREYLASVRETIGQRKFLHEEYLRARIALNEKKNRKLLGDKMTWDLDRTLADQLKIPIEQAYQSTELAKRLMFREVGLPGNGQAARLLRPPGLL